MHIHIKKSCQYTFPRLANHRQSNFEANRVEICHHKFFINIKDNLLDFDEQFGAGGLFGSAEERDYLFRFLQLGYKGYYDPGLEVHHPERNLNNTSPSTICSYSSGLGAYLKKHMFFGRHWRLLGVCFTLLLVRPIGGMLLSLVRLNLAQFKQYRTRFKGRIRGFVTYNRDSYAISKTFE